MINIQVSNPKGAEHEDLERGLQMAVQDIMDKSHHPSPDITAFCQACGAKHAFDPSVVGRKAKCLSCGHVFRVPDTTKQTGVSRPAKPRQKRPLKKSVPPPKREPQPAQQNDSKFDPLEALASSERTSASEAPAQHVSEDAGQLGEVDVISSPASDPQATVTALGIMLGLFYLALLVIGIILLHWALGIVLTIWIILPLAVVHGRKVLTRIVFLLSGKAATV